MTVLLGPSPVFDHEYALFSPEARRTRSDLVIERVLGPGELGRFRMIESHQSPFAGTYARLDTFLTLTDGWDSYGARAIDQQAFGAARKVLSLVALSDAALGSNELVPYHVAPVASGGLQLEWRRDGISLELWVGADGSLEALIDSPAAPDMIEKRFLTAESAALEIENFAR